MFQGKGFLILLVITIFALQQFETKPQISTLPQLILKDIVSDGAVAAITKEGVIQPSIVKDPLKIGALTIGALKTAVAVKTVAALKGAALVKGAIAIKGATALKAAAVVKGATALKAATAVTGATALKTTNLSVEKSIRPLNIVDTVKDTIAGIVRPSPSISIDASKPLLGLL